MYRRNLLLWYASLLMLVAALRDARDVVLAVLVQAFMCAPGAPSERAIRVCRS